LNSFTSLAANNVAPKTKVAVEGIFAKVFRAAFEAMPV
jgi:hypothetical protein